MTPEEQEYQDYIDYQDYQTYQSGGGLAPRVKSDNWSLFGNDNALEKEILAVGGRALKGAADIGDFIENINPFKPMGPRLWGNGFDDQLAKATGQEPKPTVSEEAEKLVAALGGDINATPSSNAGKIAGEIAYQLPSTLVPGAGGRAGLMSALGAGTASGATSAAGGGEGAQAIAALFGGSAPSLFKAAKNGMRSIFALSPEARASEDLLPAAKAITELPDSKNVTENPLYKFRTVAEATQDPLLASLEQKVTKTSDLGNKLLNQNRSERAAVQKTMLEGLSTADSLREDEAGILLRSILEKEGDTVKKASTDLFDSVNRQALVPIADVADDYNRTLSTIYEAGGAPSSLTGIQAELKVASRGGKAIDGEEVTKPFSYMHSLRQRAQDAWTAAKNIDDSRAAATANALVRKIDDAILSASGSGGMSPEDINAFTEAKELFRDFSSKYRSGAIGDALRKMGEGNYQMLESNVVRRVFNGKPENTKRLLAALPDDPGAIEATRGMVRDHIIRETIDNDGNIGPGKFRTFLRKNRGALEAEEGGKRLFSDKHLGVLDQIAEDAALLDPSSVHSVKRLAYRASDGQPTTAQALMQEAGKGAARIAAGSRIVGRLAEKVSTAYNKAISDHLARALFDEQYAKLLVSKATARNVEAAKAAIAAGPLARTALTSAAQASAKPNQDRPEGAQAVGSSPENGSLRQGQQRGRVMIPIAQPRGQGVGLLQPVPRSAEEPKLVPSSNTDTKLDKTEAIFRALSEANPFAVQPAYASTGRGSDVENPKNQGEFDVILEAIRQVESAGGKYTTGPETKYGVARGSYQVLDSTGKEYFKKLGLEGKYDPYNEAQQKVIAEAIIRDYMRMFDGDINKAVLAYHTGPGNVKAGKIGPAGRAYLPKVEAALQKLLMA